MRTSVLAIALPAVAAWPGNIRAGTDIRGRCLHIESIAISSSCDSTQKGQRTTRFTLTMAQGSSTTGRCTTPGESVTMEFNAPVISASHLFRVGSNFEKNKVAFIAEDHLELSYVLDTTEIAVGGAILAPGCSLQGPWFVPGCADASRPATTIATAHGRKLRGLAGHTSEDVDPDEDDGSDEDTETPATTAAPHDDDVSVDDGDDCSACSLSDEQITALENEEYVKEIVCDATCLVAGVDNTHCNYFDLGQICRGCGECPDGSCQPCPPPTPVPSSAPVIDTPSPETPETASPTTVVYTPSPVIPPTPVPSSAPVIDTPSPETPETASPTTVVYTPSPVIPPTPVPSSAPVIDTPSPETPETASPTTMAPTPAPLLPSTPSPVIPPTPVPSSAPVIDTPSPETPSPTTMAPIDVTPAPVSTTPAPIEPSSSPVITPSIDGDASPPVDDTPTAERDIPIGEDSAEDECTVCEWETLTEVQRDVLATEDKQIVCDRTCLDGVTDPLHCNYFGLGQICRGCGDCATCAPCPPSSAPTPAAETSDAPTPSPEASDAPTSSPTALFRADPDPFDDDCSVCSNLTGAQIESLAGFPDGGKQIICDPRCIDGSSDPTHCNYFGLGQICRGCGDCLDCTPCP